MICPPTDEDCQIVKKALPSNIFRKIKKSNRKSLQRKVRKRYTKFVNTMSSWAENFAVTATWQFKHQVAYWKAKALALEYENKVLHDVIRKNHLQVDSLPDIENGMEAEIQENEYRTPTEIVENEDGTPTEIEENEDGTENEVEESDTENEEDEEAEEGGFEVSEEYIQFLTANVKIKEQAKREREILQAKREADERAALIKEERRETTEECRERMKRLYGPKWQRISALEMSMLSNFIHDSDESKPSYWPNIPFNFSG